MKVLTVIISDLEPFHYLQEPIKHRTVQIQLTEEQLKVIELRHKNESISQCFIEESEEV